MVIKSIEEIKDTGLRIDEFKEMSLYQTRSNHFVLFVKEHAYPFNSADMAQKSFEIVKRLWFDDDHNTEAQLTESDIIDMYKETFNIDEVCHVCGKNKMCIDDMSGDLKNPCFICFGCDEKRYNTENEYERQGQMHNIITLVSCKECGVKIDVLTGCNGLCYKCAKKEKYEQMHDEV